MRSKAKKAKFWKNSLSYQKYAICPGVKCSKSEGVVPKAYKNWEGDLDNLENLFKKFVWSGPQNSWYPDHIHWFGWFWRSFDLRGVQ